MPIPGMSGMEHIGFTVPDINEACEWFERILGAETLYTAATDFRHDDDDWMQEHLRVHPRSVIKEFRSIPDWWDKHGDILIKHMTALGQMWTQRG